MASLLPHRRALLATLAVLALVLAILLAMHRPAMCDCGTIKLWHGVVQSSENSQHITDWYSPSHLIHGLLFYFFAYLIFAAYRRLAGAARGDGFADPGQRTRWALPIAVAFEGFWEVLENTPFIINRYREVTVSWGYVGDSIVNSMSDIGWMIVGFLLASRLPAWASVVLGVALELFTLAMIRDNLTLNVLMLLWPVDAIVQWQAG